MTPTAEAYLCRLGIEPEPPSVDLLFRIHRAHVELIPYETLWIHLGQRWGIDPRDSATRLGTSRRGGYCFHLNGALSHLLRELGFDVTLHVGGVHGPEGPTAEGMSNHLVLTVCGLPTPEHPEGTWYVDAGLGDALHDPLPLVPGIYQQGPFRLELERSPGGVGDWHLVHDAEGAFTGMTWSSEPADIGAFADRHRQLSTSPDSGFVRVLTAQRRDAQGVDILRGLSLRRIGAGATESTLASRSELADVLGGVFRLGVADVSVRALDDLWNRTQAAHDEWLAAQADRGQPTAARRTATVRATASGS